MSGRACRRHGAVSRDDCDACRFRRERALSDDLAAALKGLRYSYVETSGVEVDGFCDHAAEPCHRCEAARAALLRYSQAREDGK